jgi:hypothetical protein
MLFIKSFYVLIFLVPSFNTTFFLGSENFESKINYKKKFQTDTIYQNFPKIELLDSSIVNMIDSLIERAHKKKSLTPFFCFIFFETKDSGNFISFSLTNAHHLLYDSDLFTRLISGASNFKNHFIYFFSFPKQIPGHHLL